MAKPNPQFPRGRKANKQRDDAQYEEDRERLEKQEQEDSVPKRNKH